MYFDKQKLAFLVACLCAGSAFSAGFRVPHVAHNTSCPTAVEKPGKALVAQTEVEQAQNAPTDRKAGKSLVLNTQAGAHGAGGGGGAGKTPDALVQGQKSAPAQQ